MALKDVLKDIAKNSNGRLKIEKVPASKQPTVKTLKNLENEIGSLLNENEKIYSSKNKAKLLIKRR